MPSPLRPSACRSVCLFHTHGCICQKWLKLGSCNFHHRVAQSLWYRFNPEILTGIPWEQRTICWRTSGADVLDIQKPSVRRQPCTEVPSRTKTSKRNMPVWSRHSTRLWTGIQCTWLKILHETSSCKKETLQPRRCAIGQSSKHDIALYSMHVQVSAAHITRLLWLSRFKYLTSYQSCEVAEEK